MEPVFLVIGAPAVGKSTTCRALAARYQRAVHIPVDDLRDMVVAGRVLPSPDWPDEVTTQLALARQTAIDVATRYAAHGFAVVIDDFFDPGGLAEYRDVVARPGVRGVILFPTQDEAHRRNFERTGGDPGRVFIDEGIRHVYGLLAPQVDRLAREGWLILDTTGLSVEAAVDAIVDA
jgi:predicted kinase